MFLIILTPLVGVLGALLLSYGTWLIYPRQVLLLPGRCACAGRGWLRVISIAVSGSPPEVSNVFPGAFSTQK